MIPELYYTVGVETAKIAFLGELYNRYIKGNLGPLAGSLTTYSPSAAGLAGSLGQSIDTPPGGSKILRSIGVGGGAALANALVAPVAGYVADAVIAATGLPIPAVASQGVPSPGGLLHSLLRDAPTSLAQAFVARKGRDAAESLEQFLRKKDVRIP